jgi:hypothetical protein
MYGRRELEGLEFSSTPSCKQVLKLSLSDPYHIFYIILYFKLHYTNNVKQYLVYFRVPYPLFYAIK